MTNYICHRHFVKRNTPRFKFTTLSIIIYTYLTIESDHPTLNLKKFCENKIKMKPYLFWFFFSSLVLFPHLTRWFILWCRISKKSIKLYNGNSLYRIYPCENLMVFDGKHTKYALRGCVTFCNVVVPFRPFVVKFYKDWPPATISFNFSKNRVIMCYFMKGDDTFKFLLKCYHLFPF